MANSANMSGKTVVVTGANSGIGKVTALELAKMGADVVMISRDRTRGEEALADVKRESGSSNVRLFLADLSSQADIRRVAAELLEALPRIDVLVNNAGLILGERKLSADGLELTFATNHLGYFLLTHLLLDRLKASGPARIVNVASEAHRAGKVDLDDLQSERGFSQIGVYGMTKLCNILFTYELARRLEGSGVTANCLHPGAIATGFGQSGNAFMRFVMKLGKPFILTPEKGARTQIYLASSPEVEGVSGKYFDRCKPRKSNAQSYDVTVAKKLWEASERLCGIS
ncbi:MAG: SDR family oxidoreductase [Polyangiaceae bacterium]